MNTSQIKSVKEGKAFIEELNEQIAQKFPFHPFEDGIDKNNFEHVISEFLALSVAFPYIQAGAIYANYSKQIKTNKDVNKNVEVTSVIGSFLIWDEFGGYRLSQEYGNEGLCHLIKVNEIFHSNILRHDIEILLGKRVSPKWGITTNEYLNDLLDGLSDSRNNRNVAYMIAFEKHAQIIIQSIWNAISRVFGTPQDSQLQYFYEHVGGESPAEVYHIEMTQKMISLLVPRNEQEQFLAMCVDAFEVSIRWCESLLAKKSQLIK